MRIVRNDTDLFELIDQVLEGGHESLREIRLEDYPKLHITFRGERFDGGVPAYFVPILTELQRTVDRAVAELLGVGRLNGNTKREVEITIRVVEGSTGLMASFAKAFNSLAMRMNGSQSLTLLLVLILVAGLVWSYKIHLRNVRDVRAIAVLGDHVALSERQIEVQERLLDLLESGAEREERLLDLLRKMEPQSPAIAKARESSEEIVRRLVNKLDLGDELIIGDDFVLDGETGKEIIRRLLSLQSKSGRDE